MNIKSATKYQMYECITSVRIYYLVIILVTVFFGGITSFGNASGVRVNGGTEMPTVIFLFVLGLNSFKETFLMSLQNGITRKTMFISRLITVLFTGAGMAVIDRIILGFEKLYSSVNKNYHVSGMYEMIFNKRAESLNIAARNMEAALIISGINIAVIIAGYFITAAYYRMNKALKIIISVGVPVTAFILLPMLDHYTFNGKITAAIGRFLVFVFGGKAGNPYNLLLSCVVFAIVGIGLSWLLIRKAVEKN